MKGTVKDCLNSDASNAHVTTQEVELQREPPLCPRLKHLELSANRFTPGAEARLHQACSQATRWRSDLGT